MLRLLRIYKQMPGHSEPDLVPDGYESLTQLLTAFERDVGHTRFMGGVTWRFARRYAEQLHPTHGDHSWEKRRDATINAMLALNAVLGAARVMRNHYVNGDDGRAIGAAVHWLGSLRYSLEPQVDKPETTTLCGRHLLGAIRDIRLPIFGGMGGGHIAEETVDAISRQLDIYAHPVSFLRAIDRASKRSEVDVAELEGMPEIPRPYALNLQRFLDDLHSIAHKIGLEERPVRMKYAWNAVRKTIEVEGVLDGRLLSVLMRDPDIADSLRDDNTTWWIERASAEEHRLVIPLRPTNFFDAFEKTEQAYREKAVELMPLISMAAEGVVLDDESLDTLSNGLALMEKWASGGLLGRLAARVRESGVPSDCIVASFLDRFTHKLEAFRCLYEALNMEGEGKLAGRIRTNLAAHAGIAVGSGEEPGYPRSWGPLEHLRGIDWSRPDVLGMDVSIGNDLQGRNIRFPFDAARIIDRAFGLAVDLRSESFGVTLDGEMSELVISSDELAGYLHDMVATKNQYLLPRRAMEMIWLMDTLLPPGTQPVVDEERGALRMPVEIVSTGSSRISLGQLAVPKGWNPYAGGRTLLKNIRMVGFAR